MKKRIVSIIMTLALLMTLLPTTAMAWTPPSNIKVTKATYHSTGALASIEASFYWPTGDAAGRLVLMTEKLNTTTSSEPEYGDFTNLGTYGSSFSSFSEVESYDAANGTFGIIASSGESQTLMGQTNKKSISFDAGDIPLDQNQLYYVYLWTKYGGHHYPDTLICAIQVYDGAVMYASATGRNSYDDSAFQKVINESVSYDVAVTPAANMTRTSGSESQTGLKGAMEPVVYTADSGYEFPETYAVAAVNGIMVRRDSATQITVLGTPTADAAITLTAPTRKLLALEEMTFGYAYDVQRSPAYPKQDDDVTASSLDFPLDADGTSDYATKAGSWTLTRAGTYAYVKSIGKDSTKLKGVVDSIVSNYTGITADEVVIHELKEGTKHIAYGVTVAYNAENGTALYIGGNRSGGAGYLLSLDEVTTDPIHMTADMVATDFVPQQEISIDKSGTHTFTQAAEGYAAQTPVTVTVTNEGNTATGALNATVSSANFVLGDVDAAFKAGIAKDGTDTFTVVPKDGLTAGTYTATVTVSGVDVASKSFTVSFTVINANYNIAVSNDGNGSASADKASAAEGDEVTLTVSPSTGYKFKEWQVTPSTLVITDNKFTMPAEDVTVTAIFEKLEYTISWDTDGDGTVDDTTTVAYGTVPTHADGSKAADAQYTYTFTGWDNTPVAVTGPATYTAQFSTTTNTYPISWDIDGDGTVDETVNVAYGTVPTHADGSKTQDDKYTYTFTGWDTTPVAVTGPATYKAQFTPVARSYAVTLDANEGTIAAGKNVTTYTYGVGAALPAAADMTKTGYTFAGWYDNAGLTGTAVTAIGTDETGVKAFYAKWDANEYTVTLDANGGSVAPGSITVTYDGTYAGLVNATRTAYTFAGWFTAAEGGTEVTTATTVAITGPQTLYAHWTLNSDAELKDVHFTHGYDVQRNPAFPAKGDSIRLSGYQYPLDANGSHMTTHLGDWTLSEVGTYYSIKSTASANLTGVVNSIASNYTNIDADEIVVHQLKDGSTHIAYGVVVAYSAADGCAVFLGDTWSGGAGYLLSYGVKNDPADVTATAVPTDFVQALAYRITLDQTGTYTFTDAVYGYSAQTPLTVTVTNAGKAATGDLTVVISGTDADKFTLSKTTVDDIAVSGNDTFTVVPNTGLAIGTYTATITVSNGNVVPKEFDISFTVKPAIYTITFDANGGTVTPASGTTAGIGKLASLPTPTPTGNYAFDGWFDAPTGGNAVTTDTVFTGPAIIYAQWTFLGGSGGASTYAVELKDADNGKITIDKYSAGRGNTVKLTVTPDEGYEVKEVIVRDELSGRRLNVVKNAKGTYSFTMPASDVIVEAVFAAVTEEEEEAEKPAFPDVAENAYYADAVAWAVENGITNGTADGTFAPGAACTRAQMVTFLWRSVGSPAPKTTVCPFTDVDMSSYYGKAVLWAVENGITMGTTDTTFSPNATCTRAHMAAFLCRMAKGVPSGTVNPFTDVPAGVYYTEPVQWAVENGITNGTTATTYSPNATCTRGQMVTFLWRCLG